MYQKRASAHWRHHSNLNSKNDFFLKLGPLLNISHWMISCINNQWKIIQCICADLYHFLQSLEYVGEIHLWFWPNVKMVVNSRINIIQTNPNKSYKYSERVTHDFSKNVLWELSSLLDHGCIVQMLAISKMGDQRTFFPQRDNRTPYINTSKRAQEAWVSNEGIESKWEDYSS